MILKTKSSIFCKKVLFSAGFKENKKTPLLGSLFHALSLVSLETAGSKEFRPQRWIFGVMAPPDCGARHRRGFAHPAHFHAEMVSLQKNGNAVGMQHRFERVCDLLADPLLDRKALRKKPHQASELGNPDDIFVRNV